MTSNLISKRKGKERNRKQEQCEQGPIRKSGMKVQKWTSMHEKLVWDKNSAKFEISIIAAKAFKKW